MLCVCVFPQLGRYTREGQLFLGALGSTGEDTRCVVDDQISRFPQLLNCDKVTNVKQKMWNFSQVTSERKTVKVNEMIEVFYFFGGCTIALFCECYIAKIW